MLLKRILTQVRTIRDYLQVPLAVRGDLHRDFFRGLGLDPGIERAVTESIAWLGCAQDHSTTKDGGVARHYSLVSGWGPSYPETTGYIIPTIIAIAEKRQDQVLMQRARRMLDWLVKIQLPEGGFQGGTIDSKPVTAVTFNTGQILLGLSSGAAKFGEPYLSSMHRVAEWLVATQDRDGCWRKHATSFAAPGEKVYETHVAWGLLEAARVGRENRYANAAIRNVHWALTKQHANGWFTDCCLNNPSQPLTHTIGYALRGVLEAYRYTRDSLLLDACYRTGEGLLGAIEQNGFLPGRVDARWRGTASWACLTGSVQIAHCWLLLYQETNDTRFRDAAYAANRYVRCTISVDGPPETRGAIKGSFPIYGNYGKYEYLNWACKFFIDANLLEKRVREDEGDVH